MQDELSIAKADIAILVEERNKLFRELEEYKALYSEAASLLNSANYKLSQIRDIAEVKGGLTKRAADGAESLEPQWICMTCKTVIGPVVDDGEHRCNCKDDYLIELWRVAPVVESPRR